MKLSIIVLILVLAVGSIVISLGFLTNQEYVEIPEISNQYENLEKYKYELEKINQYNQQILKDLEEQFKNSDDVHLDQINEEIAMIKQVVNENKEELERVIKKLSQIDSKP
jgi:methyl-accepting chemotaxis protein